VISYVLLHSRELLGSFILHFGRWALPIILLSFILLVHVLLLRCCYKRQAGASSNSFLTEKIILLEIPTTMFMTMTVRLERRTPPRPQADHHCLHKVWETTPYFEDPLAVTHQDIADQLHYLQLPMYGNPLLCPDLLGMLISQAIHSTQNVRQRKNILTLPFL